MWLWILAILFSPVILIGLIQCLWLTIECLCHAIALTVIAVAWAIAIVALPPALIVMTVKRTARKASA